MQILKFKTIDEVIERANNSKTIQFYYNSFSFKLLNNVILFYSRIWPSCVGIHQRHRYGQQDLEQLACRHSLDKLLRQLRRGCSVRRLQTVGLWSREGRVRLAQLSGGQMRYGQDAFQNLLKPNNQDTLKIFSQTKKFLD